MSRAHRILSEKPSNPTTLELSNAPLARGLASVFLDGYDVVIQKPFDIFTSDLSKSFGRYGSQLTSAQAGASAPYKTRYSYQGTGYTGPLTVSALCRYENVVANGMFSIGDEDGNTAAGLGVKTSLSGSAYLRAIIYINGTTPVIATSAIVPDNAYHTVTATWDGADVITLYLDGEIIATQTGATACYLPNSFTIGAFGAAGGTGDVALATYHKRCLSAPEVRSLARQPWQIFKKPDKRQKTVPDTVTTIAATGANAVGSVNSVSTSVSTISATGANAVGSISSVSTSVSTITATGANAVGSVASVSLSASTIAVTTAGASGSVSSTSTSVTSLTATTAGAVGSVNSVSTSVCTIAAVTANAVGNVVSSTGTLTTLSATTANVVGSVNSVSVSATSIVATTAQAVGSVESVSRSVTTIAGTITSHGNVNTVADVQIVGVYASFQVVRIETRRVRVIQDTSKRVTRFLDARVRKSRVITKQKIASSRNTIATVINIR